MSVTAKLTKFSEIVGKVVHWLGFRELLIRALISSKYKDLAWFSIKTNVYKLIQIMKRGVSMPISIVTDSATQYISCLPIVYHSRHTQRALRLVNHQNHTFKYNHTQTESNFKRHASYVFFWAPLVGRKCLTLGVDLSASRALRLA